MGKQLLTPAQEGHDEGWTQAWTRRQVWDREGQKGLCGCLDDGGGQEGLWFRQWMVHSDGDAEGAALEGR